MKCQILLSGKNKKNITKCRLLNCFQLACKVLSYYLGKIRKILQNVVYCIFLTNMQSAKLVEIRVLSGDIGM